MPTTIRLDPSRPIGNFWIDMGLVVLLEQFGPGTYDANDILQWLRSRIAQKTGNIGQYYDEAAGQPREYEKINWVYPTNLFIKVSGQPGKKVKINDKEYPTQPPVFDLKLDLKKKPSLCDMCGDEAPVTDAKMWMFPFLVDLQRFANFYPGVKRGMRLCARCALAGLAGYLGWLWKAQGKDVLHFFIFHTDLPELRRLYRVVIRPLTVEGDRGGNVRIALAGKYIHETTLGLLLELFGQVQASDRLSDEGRQALAELLGAVENPSPAPLMLYAVTGIPGQAFNMQALREFTKLQSLYRLYERWLEALRLINSANPHQQLVSILSQFSTRQGKKKNYEESIWRDRIAWAILEFGDPFPKIEQFLFEVRAREEKKYPLRAGTLEVFNQYLKEVLAMDEGLQRVLAGFGHSLGTAAQEHNEMGLLYALRNAKNPEDFYRVLNDVQFRLNLTVPSALLNIEKGERIAGVPWVRVKTLLSIYAMNSFLRKGAPAEASDVNSTSMEG